ncbi:estradiol 17-beta-dehydrogenase 1-like [Anneissia japonica]|uniref:estradiol 17-beta-dehydrogenase 1-like n=1 Tax=Anneissia japonica TaxID=1529436 RepID=UPI0014256522|nr:estradiol 17-beta-dehydrogenase 1-like [Anneissia japonica]
MASRTVLITGCSSGIGLAAAVVLAKQPDAKFKVYATMRNTGKKEELEKAGRDCLDKTLFIRALDVNDAKTFKPVLDEIINSDGKLDILINNAGQGMLVISETAPVEGVRQVFNTNVIGLFQLTQAVIPIMKKQQSGHIINVTSVGGFMGVPYNAIYCASKFAVEGMTEGLACELMPDNIRFSLIEPGPVTTKFRENLQSASGTGLDSPDVDEDTKKRFLSMMTKIRDSYAHATQTADEIGYVILKAATDENPSLRYQTSADAERRAKSKLADPTGNNYLDIYRKVIE